VPVPPGWRTAQSHGLSVCYLESRAGKEGAAAVVVISGKEGRGEETLSVNNVCNTGENGRLFRREPYTRDGRRRTAKTVENVQRFPPMAYSRFGLSNSQNGQSVQARGLSAGVSWKPRRHVASSLESRSFNEGGLRAAEGIIHAPGWRSPATERAGILV
jgi:hypothetical protein